MKMIQNKAYWYAYALLILMLCSVDLLCAETPPVVSTEKAKEKELDDLLGGMEIKVIPPTIKLPKDAKLKLDLPVFGPVVLKYFKDEATNVDGFTADMPSKDKPFKFGAFSIENGRFKLSQGALTYTAEANFFGKRARIGLKDFSLNKQSLSGLEASVKTGDITKQPQELEFYTMTLEVAFLDGAAAIQVAPDKKLEFKGVELILDQRTGFELRAIGSVFGQEISLSGLVDPQNQKLAIQGALKKEKMSTMFPELAGTFMSNMSLEGTLSFVLEEDLNDFEEGLKINGKLTGANDAAAIDIGGVKLVDAEVDIVIAENDKHAFIDGKTDILGLPMTGYFRFYFGKQAGLQFRAEIQPGVNEWQPFKDSPVPDLQAIKIYDLRGGVEAQYLAAIAGEGDDADGDSEDKKDDDKKAAKPVDEYGSSAEESLFEQISERDLEIMGEEGLRFALYIQGSATILNAESKVIVKIDKMKSGFGATVLAELPDGWKISTSLPNFKPDPAFLCKDLDACVKRCKANPVECPVIFGNYVKGMIELLEINKARFVISTRRDRIDDQLIEAGFNLLAKVSLDSTQKNPFMDAIKEVVTTVSTEKASLELVGAFDPSSPRNAKFAMGVTTGGFGFKVGPALVHGGQFNIVIRGEPSIGVEGLFTLKPGSNEDPLEFAANAAFTPLKFDISGSMRNIWKDPFGIKGFEFGDLALRGSQTYTAIEEALAAAAGTAGVGALWLLVPGDVGFAGCVRFGPPEGKGRGFLSNTRINFGKDITSMAIVADICDPLSLTLLLDVMFKQLGVEQKILGELDKIMPIQLKKAGIKFVPIGTQIGNVVAKQGVGGYGYFDLFGQEAHIDFSLGLDGFTARGQVPAFEIGILKMTNYDDTCNTSVQAPKERNWGKICDCDTPNIKSPEPETDTTCGPKIDMQLNTQAQTFVIDGLLKLGDILQSKTKWYLTKDGTGFDTESFIGPESAKFGVRLKGTTIKFQDLQKIFELEPKDITLEIEFKDDLTQKIRQDVSAELNRTKEQFERDINLAIEQIGRETAEEDILKQQRIVNNAYNSRIDFWSNPWLSVQRESAFRTEDAKLYALKLKYALEKTEPGKVLGNTFRALGFDKIADGILMAFKQVGVGVIEQGQMVFKDLSRLVVIKKIYWKGSLEDLGTGKLADVDVSICAGCQQINRKISGFDLVDPLNSIATIATQIAGLVQEAVIATFKGDACDDVCEFTADFALPPDTIL